MVKRFLVGYLVIGALVSTWINLEGAFNGGETAFAWGPSLGATVAQFVIRFGTPMLVWPVIVFSQLLRVLGQIYASISRHLHL